MYVEVIACHLTVVSGQSVDCRNDNWVVPLELLMLLYAAASGFIQFTDRRLDGDTSSGLVRRAAAESGRILLHTQRGESAMEAATWGDKSAIASHGEGLERFGDTWGDGKRCRRAVMVITSAPGQSGVLRSGCLFVCIFVCPLANLTNHLSKLREIFCAVTLYFSDSSAINLALPVCG